MSNNDLYSNWMKHGLIVWSKDKTKFVWTRKAKKLVPTPVRTILASMANGKMIKQSKYFKLAVHHFDKKGFYRG